MSDSNEDLYVPADTPQARQWVLDGIKRNMDLDAVDVRHGVSTPAEAGMVVLLRTAVRAILAGHGRQSWDEVAEGLGLVIQAEFLARYAQLKQAKDGGPPVQA